MRTNLFVQTLKVSAQRITLNRTTRRVALISLFVFLALGNAWGSKTYYSRAGVKVASGEGTVYVKGGATSATTSSNDNSTNGTSFVYSSNQSASSSGTEKNFAILAVPGTDYRFDSWTLSGSWSTNPSTELASTYGKVKCNTTSSSSPTTGNAAATFVQISIASVTPTTVTLEPTDARSSCTDYTGTVTFTTSNDNAASQIGTPSFTNTGSGTWEAAKSWVAGTTTVTYTFKGNGYYGGSGTVSGSRNNSATLTLPTAGGTSSKSVTFEANFPPLDLKAGETSKVYPVTPTTDVQGSATFPVTYCDGAFDFTASISGASGGTWTPGTISVAITDAAKGEGTVTVPFTFNAGGATGDFNATLTLTPVANTGGSPQSITITAYAEQVYDYDVEVYNASGVKISDDDQNSKASWTEGLKLANANEGSTIKLMRNISDVNTLQTITKSVTIDLNGKTLSGTGASQKISSTTYYTLFYCGTAGKTITIKDSRTGGKIQALSDLNARLCTFLSYNGNNIVLKGGTIEAENTGIYNSSSKKSVGSCPIFLKTKSSFTQDGGKLSSIAGRNAYGIFGEAAASTHSTITLNQGEVNVKTPVGAYGVVSTGEINVHEGAVIKARTEPVNGVAGGATAYGIQANVSANATDASSYYSTLNMDGGLIDVFTTTTSCYGILIQGATSSATETATDGTHSNKATPHCNITGGRIKVYATSTTAQGIQVIGDTNSKTGEHVVAQIKNMKIEVEGEHPSGSTNAANIYGVYVHAVCDTARMGLRQGDVELTNDTITVTARKGQTAVAVYVHAAQFSKLGDPYKEEEIATAGKVTINSGKYEATTTTGRYAYAVQSAARVKSILGKAEEYPTIVIHDGKFTATTGTTTARAVSAGGHTTIDGGEFYANAGTEAGYGIYHVAGKLKVSGVKIKATAPTNARGVSCECAIHDYTGYEYHSEAELNNLNDSAITTTGATAYGVVATAANKLETQERYDTYMAGTANAVTKSYYDRVWSMGPQLTAAKVTINGGTFTAIGGTTTAYAAYCGNPSVTADVSGVISPTMEINNATLIAKTNGTTTAGGVYSGGTTVVNNCDITVEPQTTTGYGVFVQDNKTIVNNTKINVTTKAKDNSTAANAYGFYVNAAINYNTSKKTGNNYLFQGELVANEGNDVTVNASTGTTAYGVYVHAAKVNIPDGDFIGDYAYAGKATINGGKYTAYAAGTTAYAACVADPVVQGEERATPTLTINDGKFKGTAGATPFADVSVAGERGYFVLNGGYYVKDQNLDKKLGEEKNKVEVKSGTPEYTEGYRWRVTGDMTGEPVCKIVQNSTSYASLEEALQVVNAAPSSTWTIVMTANYTLSKGDYELPANTTLLIPYYSAQTTINGGTPAWIDAGNETPYSFRRLTFASGVNMTVKGKIEASSTTYIVSSALTGIVGGAYGWLQLNEGAHIDLESGAYIYAWGYITGDGTINAKSGSYIYEDFQMGDWRGGSVAFQAQGNKNGINDKGVFLLTHYFLQNVECEITFRPGSQEIAYSGTYMTYDGDKYLAKSQPVQIIGTSDAMFLMNTATAGEDTWVKKKYNADTDRLEWTLNSGAEVGSVTLNLKFANLPYLARLALGGDNVTVNSADYVLPLTSNFTIIANYGEVKFSNDVCLIPGCEVKIKKEATLTIPSGKCTYVYDQDNWSKWGRFYYLVGHSPSWKVSPRNGDANAKLPDAKIEVAGLLNIQGSLYTTSGGANICSTREEAGKIYFKNAAPASLTNTNTTTSSTGLRGYFSQLTANSGSGLDAEVTYTAKPVNSAWLKNEDATYTTTTGTTAGKEYVYMEDPTLNDGVYRWLDAVTSGCITTVTKDNAKDYIHPSDWVAVEANANGDHAYHNEGSTRFFVNAKAATNANCVWWEAEPKGIIDGVTYYMANNENFDNYGTYFYWDNNTSYWKPKKVTVTWKDKDGNKITNGSFGDLYNFNTSPQFFGANPVWANTSTEKHDWIGWHDEDGNIYDKNATLPRATEDITYTAYFLTSKYQYTITFKNDDNTDLWAGLVDAGTTGAQLQTLFETKYNEKTGSTIPLKAPSVDKVYTFDSWNTTLATVTAAATYTASYTWTTRKYHVTFYNYDAATVLYETDVDYNTRPVYDGVTPFRANTSAFSYEWTGWKQGTTNYDTDDELALVTGDIYYVATFEQTELKYQVFFKRPDGTIIDAPFFNYEETPAAFPANPTMASTVSTDYTFREWSPATLAPVTEDGMTYTALFDESVRQYTAHFVNYDGTTLNVDQTIDYNNVPAYAGATPFKPNDNRNSYEFAGWAWPAGDGWEAGSVGIGEALPAIKGDITFTAQFNPVLLQFNVIYQREDGTFIKQDKVKWGQDTEAPAAADCNYEDEQYTYTLSGWSPATIVNPVTTDATYTAQFNQTPRSYSVTLNTYGGTINAGNVTSYTYGTGANLPTNVTRTGYSFSGWYDNSGLTGSAVTKISATATGNKTYWAKWTAITYNLTYEGLNGATNSNPATYTVETATFTLAAPGTRSGYTFTGWTCGGDPIAQIAIGSTGDKTITANWSAVSYNLTYEGLNGASNSNPATYTVETATFTLAAPGTRAGYTFTGWTCGGIPITQIAQGSTGDKTITANWTAVTYNLTYEGLNGASNSNPATYTVETATFTLAAPGTRAGYTFTGWTCGGDPITQITLGSTGDKTITANWSAVTYDLTYEGLNGATNSNPSTYTIETATITLVAPGTREGYTFTGWTCGGDPITQITLGSTGDKTITANWEQSTVTILWMSEDGTQTLKTDEGVVIGSTPSFDSAEPTKATTEAYTYTFDGWTTEANGGGTFYAIGELPAVSAAATYYAHFTATANVASVKVGSAEPTYYTTIDDAFAFANEQTAAMEIKLLDDATASASLAYTAAYNCTLDLNNHALSGAVDKLLNINTTAKFIIDDSSEDKDGLISMIHTANARLYCLYITAGEVNLKNGKIYSKNTHTYSTASANKNSAATGVYVTDGQKFIMDNGTVESESQYGSYAIYAPAGTSTITINDGLVKGHTNTSTTAGGILCYAKGLTINGGKIVGHAWTTTSYGLYLYGGSATLNGGEIEATNDTISSKGTTTAYGIYVRYSSSTYKGVLTVPSTSTVKVLAKARTSTAYAVVVSASSTGSKIQGGTFTATAKTSYTARGISSAGTITISGGTFNVHSATSSTSSSNITRMPLGIYSERGTVTVNGNPTFNVTCDAAKIAGVFAYGTIGAKGTGKYSGTIKINGGTFNVTTATTTAYGAYAGLLGKNIVQKTENAGDTIFGQHYMPGIISITDGTFNVKATTNTAYGIVVAAQNTESGAVGTTVRIPTATITGGKFNVTGTSKTYAVSTGATNTALDIQGGWYNINTNLSGYVAPTKECNYHVLDLPESELPYKYEVAEAYKVSWDAEQNGGSCETPYTLVKKSAAIGTLPVATKMGNDFSGWFTAASGGTQITTATTITATQTYYAQFAPKTYSITYKDQGGAAFSGSNLASLPATHTYGTATALVNGTKENYTFDGWFANPECTGEPITSLGATAYTDDITLYAKWTLAAEDRELDIVDWTSSSITINVTNLKTKDNKTNWAIRVNDVDYTKSNCNTTTRTLTVTGLTLEADENLLIQVKNGSGIVESYHNYTIPHLYNSANATLTEAKSSSVVYVYGGKLTISGDTTLAALYVCPGAEVEVTNGKLTVDKLVLRTKPWATAAISGSVEATETYYTRIAPDGSDSYPTGQYYQFGLPYECAISNVRLSDGTTPAYSTTWLLKSYNEERRADKGTTENNWDALASDATIAAGRGYEMFSTVKTYREYYFPVTPTDNTSVYVTRHGDDKNNSGWNIVCSPLMSVYENESDPVDGLKVSWLLADGSYDQAWPETIWPALPFSYQASVTGYLDFSSGDFNQTVAAPKRSAAYNASIQTEWLHLDVKDINGTGDHTSIFAHPTRFDETYETGIDVAKQSLTASRAIIYSSHAYGEMAFAGVSDSLLQRGVALTVYSPKTQELTISMRDNNRLSRMAYVWLIDNETGLITDLLWNDYTFEAVAGTMSGRFIIQGAFFAPGVATDLESASGSSLKGKEKARKVIIDQKIYIMVNGHMYDTTGKLVEDK